MVSINILAVIVSAVVAMGLGFLWYSDLLFGKLWRKFTGLTAEDIGNAKTSGMTLNYILNTIGMIVMALVLAMGVDLVGAGSFSRGLEVGFWAWLGFVAPVQMMAVIYDQKPWKLYWIETGYVLVSLLLMGGILGMWI